MRIMTFASSSMAPSRRHLKCVGRAVNIWSFWGIFGDLRRSRILFTGGALCSGQK